LVVRLLVDANLPPHLARLLRERGYEASHVGEIGLGIAGDREILERAREQGWVVVTFDLDFAELAAASGGRPAGVILLRLRSARLDKVLGRLLVALAAAGDALQAGAVMVVEEARLRVRHAAS
jgi:predicted nuclease of predicted toxin-antitoxin system